MRYPLSTKPKNNYKVVLDGKTIGSRSKRVEIATVLKMPTQVIFWSTVAALVSRGVSNILDRLLAHPSTITMKSYCALKRPWVRLHVCVRWFLSRRKYLTRARNWFTKGLCFLSCCMAVKRGFCRKSLSAGCGRFIEKLQDKCVG